MEKQIVSKSKVISFAGAFIAFLIGSGFATGQEVLQYFTSYGYFGMAGVLVVYLLFLYVGINFITVGQEQNFPKGSDIFRYYCGKSLGTFFDYFSIVGGKLWFNGMIYQAICWIIIKYYNKYLDNSL